MNTETKTEESPPKSGRSTMQMVWLAFGALWALLFVVFGIYALILGNALPAPIAEPAPVQPSGVSTSGLIERLKQQAAPAEKKAPAETPTDREPVSKRIPFNDQAMQIGQCAWESNRAAKLAADADPAESASASDADIKPIASKVGALMEDRVQRNAPGAVNAWANDLARFACIVYKHPDVVALRRANKGPEQLFPVMLEFHAQAWKESEGAAFQQNLNNERAYKKALQDEVERAEADHHRAQVMKKWLMFLLATGLVVSLYLALIEALFRLRKQGA